MKNRTKITIFIGQFLAVLLMAGCQSGPVSTTGDGLDMFHDDLYRSKVDDNASVALYHYSAARLAGMDGDLVAAARELESAVAADPDSAYLHITLAEVYMHLEQFEKAFRSAEDALIREPDLLQGHLLMANLYSLENRYEASIFHLEKVLAIEPDNQRVKMQLALYYDRINEMVKVVAILKELIAETPDNSFARLSLARAYRKSTLDRQAEQEYKKLLEREPESFLAISELGNLYSDTGRKEMEEALYLDYLQDYPEDSRLRHRLVGTYVDRDLLDNAMQHLLVLLDQNPTDSSALRKVGLLNIEKGEWRQASDYFQQLIQLDRNDSQAYYYLGIAREEEGLWEEANEAFASVAADSSVYEDALIHQGYNLHQLERTADAVALLEQHREQLSSRPEIFDYLSFLYNALDRRQDALAIIKAGLQKYPEDNTLLFRRVVLLEQAGDNDAADDAARQLLQINPDHANALNYLAYSYAVRNVNLDEALQMVQKALSIRDEYHIRDTLGWVLYRLGQYDAALVELKLAVKGNPDDPVVLEHLGDIYQALGRHAEALDAFQTALSFSENGKETLLEKIENLKGSRN